MAKKITDPWQEGIKRLEFLERSIAVRKVYYAMSKEMGTQNYMIHANRQCLLDNKRQLTEQEERIVYRLMSIQSPLTKDREAAEQVLKMLEKSTKKFKR